MIDPVDIMNEFTRYDPSKGQPPLDLPIPGYWFKKICALADRIAKAENRVMEVEADLEAYRDSGVHLHKWKRNTK